ncbi:Helix-turn-helix domain protein [uncultured archaeon]|nr:Helix-turn-helix domain protein [uncultured archaeon]
MKNEEMLIELLGNKYSRSILSLTSSMECSAFQLCNKLGIPLATVYRKLKLLEDIGLIRHVKTIIHLSGNEEKYYRCAIRDINVSFQKGMLSVDLNMEECNDKIVRLWQRLAKTEARNKFHMSAASVNE